VLIETVNSASGGDGYNVHAIVRFQNVIDRRVRGILADAVVRKPGTVEAAQSDTRAKPEEPARVT